ALSARVTATCGPSHAVTVESLGADRIVDYSRVDFTRRPHSMADTESAGRVTRLSFVLKSTVLTRAAAVQWFITSGCRMSSASQTVAPPSAANPTPSAARSSDRTT